MLSMDFIKANRETVERAIRDKGVALDFGALLALDTEVRALKTEIESLRAERNAISALFPKASPEEKAELGSKAKDARQYSLLFLSFSASSRRSRGSAQRR